MDLNSQTPQPEQKQSFWAKLFGGKKDDTAASATPLGTTPPTAPAEEPSVDPAPATTFGPSTADITPAPVDTISEPTPSFTSEPTAPEPSEEPLAPINSEPTSAPLGDTPVDQVPQEDVSKVDEALNSLPPLPVAADEPPTGSAAPTPSDDLPQPPVDPMVSPIPPSDPAPVDSTENQPPVSPLNP